MRIATISAWFSLALQAVLSTHAQGTFQNLDFESANLTPIPPGQGGGFVSIASALPGWSASIGGNAITQVLQNNYSTGQASIDIIGPNWGYTEPGIIDGDYAVFIQGGAAPGNSSVGANASIWQTGIVPANTQSLQFIAWSFPSLNTEFVVSFDGNSLSPVVLSTGQSPSGQPYSVYGINMASYAGDTGRLQFTSVYNGPGPSWTELDDITFSANAVPEPDSVALMLMAGAAFGGRLWYKKRL